MRHHLSVAFLPLLMMASTAQADDLPHDVAKFVERRELCDHFRGEAGDNDEAREKDVDAAADTYCKNTDKNLADLKKKYANRPSVMQTLNGYEPCVEATSNCRE